MEGSGVQGYRSKGMSFYTGIRLFRKRRIVLMDLVIDCLIDLCLQAYLLMSLVGILFRRKTRFKWLNLITGKRARWEMKGDCERICGPGKGKVQT